MINKIFDTMLDFAGDNETYNFILWLKKGYCFQEQRRKFMVYFASISLWLGFCMGIMICDLCFF